MKKNKNQGVSLRLLGGILLAFIVVIVFSFDLTINSGTPRVDDKHVFDRRDSLDIAMDELEAEISIALRMAEFAKYKVKRDMFMYRALLPEPPEGGYEYALANYGVGGSGDTTAIP